MKNKQKNPRRRLNSLILLVAFTAIMLIVSTYAWFSAQKNVTISGLEGKVNVAEGLMVSLDAKNWTQAVELDDTNVTKYLDSGFTLANPYDLTTGDGNENLKSSELVPVSTTGTEDTRIDDNNDGDTEDEDERAGSQELTFYRGINVGGKELHTIQTTVETETDPTKNTFPGYHAIDIFLQNSSKLSLGADNAVGGTDANADEVQGVAEETLQLNTNSLLQLVTGGSEATGLQNTTRVALALYNYAEDAGTETERTKSVHVTATQSQILNAYKDQTITDVAIWEPNAGNHVDYVVNLQSQYPITWNSTVRPLYLDETIPNPAYTGAEGQSATIAPADRDGDNEHFTATEKLPTYALTAASANAAETLTATEEFTGIADIYKWNTDTTATTTGLLRQIALQTEKSENDYTTISGGVRNLVSITSSGAAVYEMGNETGAVEFQIKKNQIAKVRLYIWLEGQDLDTINYASHGGGVHLDLGLVKGQVVGSGAGS